MTWDAAVIGAGPAGLSAATWLARYRRSVLLFDDGEPRNRWVEESHGYLSSDPITPEDLRARGLDQLSRYESVEHCRMRVDEIAGEAGALRVRAGGQEFAVASVVLATGSYDEFPAIEGFETHYGTGIFHCPACDGYESRDKDVAVVGAGSAMSGFARSLLNWAGHVTLVTPRLERGVGPSSGELDVVEGEPVAVTGERGALRSVRLASGQEILCEVAFFSLGHRPTDGLAGRLGCASDEQGHVLVDEHGATSVDGVFAAGDLTPGLQLLQVAAAEGAVAGVGCAEWLLES